MNFLILFLVAINIFCFNIPKVMAAGYSCVCTDLSCEDYPADPIIPATQQCKDFAAKKSDTGTVCKIMPGSCVENGASSAPKTPPASKPSQDSKTIYTKLDNPLGGVKTPTDIIGQVIKVAMSVMGGAVLLMVVKGATTWITAGGNAENIESGTKTIIWAIIGAILTVGSYIVLSGIMNAYFHPLAK